MPGRSKPEPSRLILLDLSSLVAGVAILASTSWYSARPSAMLGWPAPAWYATLLLLRELTSKACLALVPVILARRAQFGGLIRPAELLAAAVGLPELALALSASPVLGLFADEGGVSVLRSTLMYHGFQAALLASGVLGLVLFLVGTRLRRWPGWACSAGLLLAFFGLSTGGLYWGGQAIISASTSLYGESGPNPFIYAVSYHALGFAFAFAWGVPLVAALRSSRRRQAGPTWLERAGLVIPVVAILALHAERFARNWLSGPTVLLVDQAIAAALLLLAVGLSVPIVRRIGPAWDLASAIAYNEGPRIPAGHFPGGSP